MCQRCHGEPRHAFCFDFVEPTTPKAEQRRVVRAQVDGGGNEKLIHFGNEKLIHPFVQYPVFRI